MTTEAKVKEEKLSETEGVKQILASGKDVGMRMWKDEEPNDGKENHSHAYETVGYVLKGKAKLHVKDKEIELTEGDSYLVPGGAEHRYEILETFSAVEATSPPAHLQD